MAGTLNIATYSFGPAEYPLLAAIDELRTQGHTVELTQLTGIDLAIEGVAQGDFHTSFAGFNNVVSAIELGAPLTNIMQRRENDWSLWATTEVATCEDLDGAALAVHAETASTAWMARDYVAQECPGTEPNYLVLPGSENRYAALIAGEIDASPVELIDALNLQAEAPGRFHELASFADALPDLIVTSQFVNAEWAEENPEMLHAFIRAVLEQHRLIWENPDYLGQLDEQYRGEYGTEPMSEEALEAYSTLFPVNGGLTEDRLDFSMEWYERVELLPSGIDPAGVADLSYLDAVLDEIGTE